MGTAIDFIMPVWRGLCCVLTIMLEAAIYQRKATHLFGQCFLLLSAMDVGTSVNQLGHIYLPIWSCRAISPVL